MFMPDPKKAASSILSKMGGKSEIGVDGPIKEGGPEEDDSMSGLHAAAEDVMSAFEAKDVKGLASGLKSFFSMADMDDDEADEDGFN